jgi:hypothetical protein
MTRLLILGPGHRSLLAPGEAVPPALAAAEALAAAARARDICPVRLAALAAGTPGLRQPPGAVFTGLPGTGEDPGPSADTALILPVFEPALMLNRSWYVMEKLAEFLSLGRFDGLALVHGAPAGLDILPLARRVRPACRVALVLPPGTGDADGAGTAGADPAPDPGAEARVVAARVLAETARAADLVLALPGAVLPEGLDPARIRPVPDAAACLERLMGA